MAALRTPPGPLLLDDVIKEILPIYYPNLLEFIYWADGYWPLLGTPYP